MLAAKDLELLRAEYRKHHRNSGLAPAVFTARVRGLARELADGEEPNPMHYVHAAREVAEDALARNAYGSRICPRCGIERCPDGCCCGC